MVGEALIPVSRLPQNEPVEQWYGLQPPEGSGKTFTKAALLLRFLFTTTSSPASASASSSSAAAAAHSGAEFAGAGAGHAAPSTAPSTAMERPIAAGDGGGRRSGVAGRRGLGLPSAGGGTGGSLGGTGDDGGLLPVQGSRGGERGTAADGGAPGRILREGRSLGWEGRDAAGLAVDESIDPFGGDDEEGGSLGAGDSRKGELTLLRAQQLQLGGWGSTQAGTLHAVSVV